MPKRTSSARVESSATVGALPQPKAVEIRQSNALTTARYDLTAMEMDIMFALLSRLNKNDKPGTMYRLRVQELAQLTERDWNYARLGPAVDTLMDQHYHIPEVGGSWLKVAMLASAEYIKGQGVIELEISEKLRPYLIDLKNNFTSYRLQSVLSLSSKYAKRVYELSSQWKDIGATKTYLLNDFKYMLNLKDPTGKEPEQYVQISALKKYVLDIAVEQINEHTDLTISYKLGKVGRSYQTICFYVSRQQPQQLPIAFEFSAEDGRTQKARQHLNDLGIKDQILVDRVLSTEALLVGLFDFVYKNKTGKIKANTNAGGLFLKMHGLVRSITSIN